MKISIQISNIKAQTWSDCSATIHEVENWEQAIRLAYCISHCSGNSTVRLTEPLRGMVINADNISRLNGTYIQSTEPLTVEQAEEENY